MRRVTSYLVATTGGCLLLVGMLLHSRYADAQGATGRAVRSALVRDLQLTDLCLVTEARYTRHPAMADVHSPFQDHPSAMEHFPSGSFVAPPLSLMRPDAPAH